MAVITYPGASPEKIEQTVTKTIEKNHRHHQRRGKN